MSHPFQRSRYIPSQCGFCGHPENDAVHSGFTPAEIATARHEELMQAFGKILAALNEYKERIDFVNKAAAYDANLANTRLEKILDTIGRIEKRLDGIEPKQDALLGQGTALSTQLSEHHKYAEDLNIKIEGYNAQLEPLKKEYRENVSVLVECARACCIALNDAKYFKKFEEAVSPEQPSPSIPGKQ